MHLESDDVFRRRVLILVLLLGLFCFVTVGLHIYLSSGRLLSVGHFQCERRHDSRWSYQKAEGAGFAISGDTIRTGDTYSLGPFRLTHWKRDWSVK
jgi:hypothetical protein